MSYIEKKEEILKMPVLGKEDVLEALNQAKQAIKDLFLEIVGEDDADTRGQTQSRLNEKYHTRKTKSRNELRNELRERIEKI